MRTIESLEPGRLAVLLFAGEPAKCVGYIEDDGLCGWPERAEGKRPAGWLELSALFDGMSATIRKTVGKAL